MDPSSAPPPRMLIWMYAPEVPQWHMPAAAVDRIRDALGPEWRLERLEVPLDARGDGASEVPGELIDAIAGAEAFVGFGISPEAFRAAGALRWVHSGAAGVGAALFPEMVASDVVLTNSAGIHADSMAEHALAMLFHFSRGLDVATRAAAGHDWAGSSLTGVSSPLLGPLGELSGATLGIVGYGGIGAALGRRAHALGMRVRAIRRTRGALPPELEWLGGAGDLPDLLAGCDAVAVTVPETPDTRQLIGAVELAILKPTAVLLNLSRGAVVDEGALAKALMERRLRGAGLDVFQREPLPADHPLWELDNVLITPHVGGTSGGYWERETALILHNVSRYRAGEPLVNRVDKERGY